MGSWYEARFIWRWIDIFIMEEKDLHAGAVINAVYSKNHDS